MRDFLRVLQFIALGLVAVPGSGLASCPVSFLARVELRGQEFSLADILDAGTCPRLLRAAGQISLGRAPREGSVRVLEKDQIRPLLGRAMQGAGIAIESLPSENIPERIVIRRGGIRSSCSDIAHQLNLAPHQSDGLDAEDCGVSRGIRKGVRFAVDRRIWDPALQRWTLIVRCTTPADCVPFLLRGPDSTSADDGSIPVASRSRTAYPASTGKTLLRAGQSTTLIWEQGGIRMVLPAVSLDAGSDGDIVRARVLSTRLLLRARITPQATLLSRQ
jgi:hypothetical protein